MFLVSHLGQARNRVYSFFHVRTVGATVIAVDESGQVILVRNSYGPGEWRLPGGGVRRQESVRQAAIREAREEVGVDHREDGGTIDLLGIYCNHWGNWQNHVAVFVMKGWQQVESHSWEVDEIGRFSPDALPENTAPGHRRRIEEWQGRRTITDRW